MNVQHIHRTDPDRTYGILPLIFLFIKSNRDFHSSNNCSGEQIDPAHNFKPIERFIT